MALTMYPGFVHSTYLSNVIILKLCHILGKKEQLDLTDPRLRTHHQKMTVAAMQIALMKVWAQR